VAGDPPARKDFDDRFGRDRDKQTVWVQRRSERSSYALPKGVDAYSVRSVEFVEGAEVVVASAGSELLVWTSRSAVARRVTLPQSIKKIALSPDGKVRSRLLRDRLEDAGPAAADRHRRRGDAAPLVGRRQDDRRAGILARWSAPRGGELWRSLGLVRR
jgi:hypothetical protein